MITPEHAFRTLSADKECAHAVTAIKMLVLAGRTPAEVAECVPPGEDAALVYAAACHLAKHPELCRED